MLIIDIFLLSKSFTKVTKCRNDLPNLSSFHITNVSSGLKSSIILFNTGLSLLAPLAISLCITVHTPFF